MALSFDQSFVRANNCYQAVMPTIKDEIGSWFLGYYYNPVCVIESVEYADCGVTNMFDMIAGIDAVIHCYDAAPIPEYEKNPPLLYTLAIRFSNFTGHPLYPFNTFTIRPTEERKRLESIKMKSVYPTHTTQVYMNEDETDFMSWGIVRTDYLYQTFNKGYYKQNDGFKSVKFSDVIRVCGSVVRGEW